jgi:hypothetical protein
LQLLPLLSGVGFGGSCVALRPVFTHLHYNPLSLPPPLPHTHSRPLADGFFAYFKHPGSVEPEEVMLFDDDFRVITTSGSTRLKLVNRARGVVLDFQSFCVAKLWLDAIGSHCPGAFMLSPLDNRLAGPQSVRNRYELCSDNRQRPCGSFARVALGCSCVWLVDGSATYAAMARAMLDAKSQIFIAGVGPGDSAPSLLYLALIPRSGGGGVEHLPSTASPSGCTSVPSRVVCVCVRALVAGWVHSVHCVTGWWVSPDVRMVRDEVNKTWVQLQDILLLKATQGVEVFILLYREVHE